MKECSHEQMRNPRVLGEPAYPVNFYHCISRILGELPAWDAVEKEHLRLLLSRQLAFSGLEMITFCFMGNHFHLLLAVPSERESLEAMSDQAFLERLGHIYEKDEVELVALELKARRQAGHHDQALELRRPYLERMHDLSTFMAELKQRFTTWYNRRHDREGTVWRGRFKSVLVEDDPGSLRSMAAYIDLNPIRAGLVSDPLCYRWSGYAEAAAGGELAQHGLRTLVRGEMGDDQGTGSWPQVHAIYRCWLYDAGKAISDENGQVTRRGFAADEAEEVLARQGALSQPVLASCRIRHFTNGVAIGSRSFVEKVFQRYRLSLGPRLVNGARRIPALATSSGLMNLRELRCWRL
jgi:REP element-mobilizing transposase RayT